MDNRRLSLLLAAEGHRRAGSIETLGGLQRALTGSLGFLGYFGEGPTYWAVALGPDDRLVVVTALAAEVYDLETGELEQRTPLPEGATVVALAPRGQLVAVAREDDTAAVLDTGTGGELGAPLEPSAGAPLEMALSRDLGHLATTHADGTVLLWDLTTGRERTIVTDLAVVDQARIVPVAFSPDGSLLATGSGIPPDANAPPVVGVRVWDVPSGAQLGGGFEPNPSLEDEPERGVDRGFGTQALAFDADGRTLTTVGRWTVRRWSLETGEMLSDFLVPGARDYSTQTLFGYAQLSDTVGAGLLPGGSVSVFDLQSGELLEELIDTQLTAGGLAASADGSAAAVAGEDGIGLWSTTGQQLLGQGIPAGSVDAASFNADGTRLGHDLRDATSLEPVGAPPDRSPKPSGTSFPCGGSPPTAQSSGRAGRPCRSPSISSPRCSESPQFRRPRSWRPASASGGWSRATRRQPTSSGAIATIGDRR